MSTYAIDKATKDELDDLHSGLHFALDYLINSKDYDKGIEVLRQIDHRLTLLINNARVIK